MPSITLTAIGLVTCSALALGACTTAGDRRVKENERRMNILRSQPLLRSVPAKTTNVRQLEKLYDGADPVGTLQINESMTTPLEPPQFALSYLHYLRATGWSWIRVDCFASSHLVSVDAGKKVGGVFVYAEIIAPGRDDGALVTVSASRSGAYDAAPDGPRSETVKDACPAALRGA